MKSLPVLFLLITLTAQAQQDNPPEADQPPRANPCDTAKHHQFDFWLGQWNVTAKGKPAGSNRIEAVHNGCALAEHWTSANGNFAGSSLNIYDRATDKWHQTWVDTAGTLLQLDGGLEDGRMVLRGMRPGPDGSEILQRITWTPNEDGSVRQHWETSGDGESWKTVFDGRYVKADGEE